MNKYIHIGGGHCRETDSFHSHFLSKEQVSWFIFWNTSKLVLHSPVWVGRKFIITSLSGSLKYPFILKMFRELLCY